ncbi:ATP-binding protein [Streptomyces sp. DT24]|uniref:ATP-binding protein n=1 Tax=unclassified Streptomyces TaxID=2593676 RepID=UPI0023B8BC7C|nr:ATP-binding protein [Streptomyces sp. AM 4-1-1]WEH37081.1 ATP-binding protein [Streptomyces sp. AM 4-1-1]
MSATHRQHRQRQNTPGETPALPRPRDGNPADLTPHLSLGAPPFAAHRIPASVACLGETRRFTSDVLSRWHLDPVREDTVQIVSELVANAVCHGRRRTPLPDSLDPSIWLALTRRPRTLLCVVYDPSRRRPRLTMPAPLAERHRGLPIVQALSEDWGWKPAGRSGKAVWARISLNR